MKKTNKYISKLNAGYEIVQVSALINGVKHIFTGNRIFTDTGVEIK